MKTKDQLVQLGIEDKKADEIMLLQSKMLEEAVKFQFKKKSGEIRDAVGTLKREKMIQEDGTLWEPKGEAKPAEEQSPWFKYFDLEAKGWRQFNVFNIVAVEG